MPGAPNISERLDNSCDERTSMRQWLDIHRAILCWKCEGLSTGQLAEQPVPSSNLSLHGLVRHMAAVERNWFRNWVAAEGAPQLYWSEADPDGDFDNVGTAVWAEDLATWEAEVDRARAIEAAVGSLEELRSRPGRADHDVRWIMVHMIEEYARHNGHADLIRELVDGATGDGWD